MLYTLSCYWLLCFLTASYVSALETALLGMPAPRIRVAMEEGILGARLLSYWLRYPSHLLASLTFWRYFFIFLGGMLIFQQCEDLHWGQWGKILAVLLSTSGVLIFCHLLPRVLTKPYAVVISSRSMWLVLTLSFLVWPLIWPMLTAIRFLSKAMGQPLALTAYWTADEIEQVTNNAHAQSLDGRGEDLFLSMIEFSDTIIREIMVPRTEMVTMSLHSSREDVLAIIRQVRHSRVPIFDDTIDNISGILHVKDLVVEAFQKEEHSLLKNILRPTFYVPEVMKISELLREFQRRKTHMAIVVDEYGGTAGVVTLEDIIEEIVGEIHDEYDVEEKQFRIINEHKIIADARVSIWELEKALGVEFPSDTEYETLAGFLLLRTGSLPEKGSVIAWNNLRFHIKEANEKRVGMVEIERRQGEGVLDKPKEGWLDQVGPQSVALKEYRQRLDKKNLK